MTDTRTLIAALAEAIATTLRREGVHLATYGKLGLDLQLTERVCTAIATEAVHLVHLAGESKRPASLPLRTPLQAAIARLLINGRHEVTHSQLEALLLADVRAGEAPGVPADVTGRDVGAALRALMQEGVIVATPEGALGGLVRYSWRDRG